MNDIINGAPAPLPMPWNQLRAWIDEQEALERESNHPAPLTKIQLTSLSNLVSFIDDEPELSGEDYVSRLVRMLNHPPSPFMQTRPFAHS